MRRKLSPEREFELALLYRVGSVIADFLDVLDPAPRSETYGVLYRQAFEARHLAALRTGYNDLVAHVEALSLAEKHGLDTQLRTQAGVTLTSLLVHRYQRIERIKARGRLTSEEQYYIVREYIDFAAKRS